MLRTTATDTFRWRPWREVHICLIALALLAGMTGRTWSGEGSPSSELVFLCPSAQRQGVKLEMDGTAAPVPETGPWQISCKPGPHRISAARTNSFPIEQTVDLYEGQNLTVALMWQPLPAGVTLDKLLAAKKSQGKPGQPNAANSALSASGDQPAEPSKPKPKLPVPPAFVQASMIRLVDEAYKIEGAKTPAEKVKLGKQLASLVGASQKPEERFILLRRAAELARDAGHLPMMCQMIEAIGGEFETDMLMVQAKMFDIYASAAETPIAITTGLNGARELVSRALAEDRYDVAIRVIDSTNILCEKSSDAHEEFEQKRAEVIRLREQWEQVRAAQASLKATPDDAKANFLVGHWLLLQKGDAKQGLAHLAKGSDSTFRQLAQQELAAQPTEVESLVKAADAWWELADVQTDESKEQLARHAGQLYKVALPKLSAGLRKALVERRLEELAAPKRVVAETVSQQSEKAPREPLRPEVLPLGRVVDLLPLVDIKRDSTGGFWEWKGDVLVTSQPKKNATVLLPAAAEGDYRLEAQFTRTSGQDAVAMIVPVGGNLCLMTFSESSGKVSRLGVDVKLSRSERESKIRVEPGDLTNNQKHAVSVLVRLRGDVATIQVSLDGEPYFFWSGDPKAVSANGWPMPPVKQFAIGTNESVTFHSVRLRPISGKITLLVPANKGQAISNSPPHSAMTKRKNRS